ncbi:neuropeptide-like protein 32 [Schistocerca americana]|uniref:neuropeptide-like protein 32 n=1 Tax=Schistocerca americana TaxID=7009 RepID=UPI001F4FC88C|nr:neuropeptide-like protein 32 [Schistocerca americana]XP_049960418.1 neuropeptide-like protein 32 [Schistocerca serialis cubense]
MFRLSLLVLAMAVTVAFCIPADVDPQPEEAQETLGTAESAWGGRGWGGWGGRGWGGGWGGRGWGGGWGGRGWGGGYGGRGWGGGWGGGGWGGRGWHYG